MDILNLKNIMLRVNSYNIAGIKAYKKAGFTEFGKRSSCVYVNGNYFDDIYMEIIDKDSQTNYLGNILPSQNKASS